MHRAGQWATRGILLLVLAVLLVPQTFAQTRADPDTWILWRCGPIPLPNIMRPAVPELSSQPAIDLGRFGDDLRIVLPDAEGSANRDQKALRRMAELIVDKGRRAKIVSAGQLTAEDRTKTLLVLGTFPENSIAREILKNDATLLADVHAGGYAIQPSDNPWAAGKKCIVALGGDAVGAWAAAEMLAFSIHPEKEQLGKLRNWPVQLPEGTYWLPFVARYTLDPWAYEIKPPPDPVPPKPRVPFGVRIWGSPMPTLESYQRVVRSLARTGMNTVVVQSGGWVDLPDAPAVFSKALDIAWQEGLYTVLYVGNEEVAHLPAPLSPAHRAVVLATRDHPGLLGWHLYNQLAAKLTPEQRDMVREQLAWLHGVSDKPIGNEVVWGHNSVEIPDDKQGLIRDLKSWGNDVIATDYAPIGGWTKVPEMSRWEAQAARIGETRSAQRSGAASPRAVSGTDGAATRRVAESVLVVRGRRRAGFLCGDGVSVHALFGSRSVGLDGKAAHGRTVRRSARIGSRDAETGKHAVRSPPAR